MKSNGNPSSVEASANEASPVTVSITISDEERVRRTQAAAERLANLAPGEWRSGSTAAPQLSGYRPPRSRPTSMSSSKTGEESAQGRGRGAA